MKMNTCKKQWYSTKQVLDELLSDSESDVDYSTSSISDSEDGAGSDARSESESGREYTPTSTGMLFTVSSPDDCSTGETAAAVCMLLINCLPILSWISVKNSCIFEVPSAFQCCCAMTLTRIFMFHFSS